VGRVTIIDVAKTAGVAVSSASVALNGRPGVSEETRQRVQSVADSLGFVPSLRAKSLSSKRAFTIGLVVQRSPDVLESDPFFGALIGGIETAIDGHDYALILQVAADDADAENHYRRLAANRRVDGVILDELRDHDPRIALVQELALPAVAIIPDKDTFPLSAVRQSSAPGITELVDHLVALGHARIAHVSGSPHYVHTRERIEAWREALEAHGLQPGPLIPGDFTSTGGHRAADQLLALADRPTAVVCANDLCAVGLMNRLQDRGLTIPQDVSVTGFDGIALGEYVRPALTTVRSTPARVGKTAALLLLDTIRNPTAIHTKTVLPGRMVVRASTGPCPT